MYIHACMHAKVRVAVRRSGVSEWTAYQPVGRRGWRGDDGVIESSADAHGRVAVVTSSCLRVAGCLRARRRCHAALVRLDWQQRVGSGTWPQSYRLSPCLKSRMSDI